MARLLNPAIVVRWARGFTPSSIDMLGGLSQTYILRMPPGFCAKAVSAPDNASDSAPAAASKRRYRFISVYLLFQDAGSASPPLHPRWPVYWALLRDHSLAQANTFQARRILTSIATGAALAPVGSGQDSVVEPQVFEALALVAAVCLGH